VIRIYLSVLGINK